MEPGRSWETDTSRGAPFLAPVGSFELLDGMAHLPAEVLIEVTAIDDVHRAAKSGWSRPAGKQRGIAPISAMSRPRLEVARVHHRTRARHSASPSGSGKTRCTASRSHRRRSLRRRHALRHRRRPLECRHHRPPAAGRARRSAAQRRSDATRHRDRPRARRVGDSLRRAHARGKPKRSTPSSRSAACCAAKPPTTRPSTTR